MGKDLGLSGEAKPLIANAVREQILHHKRVAIELELLGSGAAYENALKEIETSYEEEAEAERRNEAGLPPLLAIPPHMRSLMTSGTNTGVATPTADDSQSDAGTPAADEASESQVQTPEEVTESGRRSSRRFQSPEPMVEMTPIRKRRQARAVINELLNKGARPLKGAWRDWHESRDFGPLLELLTEGDLEKLDAEALRSARWVLTCQMRTSGAYADTFESHYRRGRREQARFTATGRGARPRR